MDALIAAIAASPDDDAPRLVWADREGGERGELVILQCRIAAREGSRADSQHIGRQAGLAQQAES